MNSMTVLKKLTVFQDQYGRQKRKLRISVTDRCNFKCVYCMPEHPEWMKKQDLLSFEDLYAFCEFMVQRGIEQIRITGGEPLMRQGVVHFIEQLQALKALGLKRISMTTNAHYLEKYAQALKKSGLDDLNISLDSLDPAQFQQITQKPLAPVLAGIKAAKNAGFNIKINTVLMKGLNEDQVIALVKWSQEQGFEQRFIEFMPLDGDQLWSTQIVVSEQEILQQLESVFNVQSIPNQGANPARGYSVNGQAVGIISTITHSFCGECDRLRLNAQGELYNCLFAMRGLNLKSEIRGLRPTSQSDQDKQDQLMLQSKLHDYIWAKKQGFHEIQQLKVNQQLAQNQQQNMKPLSKPQRKISMYMIGG
ncbi:GTP 3',8-cyclase MoaA [Acinetobacter sp. 194]|uniref:GTP 3',8-cyclase MoaA n=1 Tax=Acinetobacter shaoyimingii TaxID=2715164 RepID=UPI00140C2F2A|nr:GTP 3',8-cyclase MoaA [Acinetobacter shaoyimingii]NHB58521.1 GTP 3',8-cyclase MoaA [Acinetobacter shaoyimingii]